MKITQITKLAVQPRITKFNDGEVVKDYTSQNGNAFKLLLAKGVEISLQNGFINKTTLAGVMRIPAERWDDTDLNLYKNLIKEGGFVVKTSTAPFYAGQDPVPNSDPEIYRDVELILDERLKGQVIHVQLSPEEVEMPTLAILDKVFGVEETPEKLQESQEKAPF